ncbi:MAG: 6,7-dimethyl-8-ribityllumazine synthase [Legionellales bacterium]
MQIIEGHAHHHNEPIAIVMSRFNSIIVDNLLKGALDTFKRHGVVAAEIAIIRVPGALELPIAVQTVAAQKKYAGILALGCVIRGETPHFDYVAGESIKGLHQISLANNLPIIMSVLTTDTVEQAFDRAGAKSGNKGSEGAIALLEMIDLLKKLPYEKK